MSGWFSSWRMRSNKLACSTLIGSTSGTRAAIERRAFSIPATCQAHAQNFSTSSALSTFLILTVTRLTHPTLPHHGGALDDGRNGSHCVVKLAPNSLRDALQILRHQQRLIIRSDLL